MYIELFHYQAVKRTLDSKYYITERSVGKVATLFANIILSRITVVGNTCFRLYILPAAIYTPVKLVNSQFSYLLD